LAAGFFVENGVEMAEDVSKRSAFEGFWAGPVQQKVIGGTGPKPSEFDFLVFHSRRPTHEACPSQCQSTGLMLGKQNEIEQTLFSAFENVPQQERGGLVK
jgi:hypothetical protein